MVSSEISLSRDIDQRDISNDWLFQSPETGELVPYHGNQKTKYLCQWLPFSQVQGSILSFKAQKGLCLFIDNKLMWTSDKISNCSLEIGKDVLVKKNNHSPLLLLFWHPEGKLPFHSVFLQFINTRDSQTDDEDITPLRFPYFKNYFFLIIIIILSGIMFLQISYPGFIIRSFQQLISENRSRELEKATGFFLTSYHILFSLIFVLTIAWHVVLILHYVYPDLTPMNFFSSNPFSQTVYFAGMVVFIYLAKFIIYRICGYIFNHSRLLNRMFGLTVQWDFFLSLFLFTGILFFATIPARFFLICLKIEMFLVFIYIAYRSVKVYHYLATEKSFLKLHLFFYLCTLEIIPICILTRFLLYTN
ncbi:MAG: hypothetical protein A3G23_05450 [Bacteroidetes bacterium RIFCSPLOWO2_12_FULL_37_12]|nr:MAG: hypothetical protein A3G23_05450 [Bacteroidetes bacterium RIFCSPLOWO2_12_FULL_37_12]